MRVLGIDVAKNSVVCCLLTREPRDIRQAYRDSELFFRFNADASGMQGLLEIMPDVAILEPTGINYSRLWQKRLEQAGVKVYLVGHNELSSYRKSLGLPDKDDEADSLTLASCYFHFSKSPRRFLAIKEPCVSILREKIYTLEHYGKIRNSLTNRLKQQLTWQFPEISDYTSKRKMTGQPLLLWRWLAGISNSTRYDRLYAQSVGEGIQSQTRDVAQILCDLQYLESEIEAEILEALKDPRFARYIRVFGNFGFGEKLQAILLSEIYPIEKFFDENGKPEILISTGKISGKPTKKNLSKRRFKKILGAAPVRDWSGDKKAHKKVGGALVKKKLYLWILTRIAPKKSRPQNAVGESLGELFDFSKEQKLPTRKAWAKVRCKAVEILYDRLSHLSD